MTERISAPRVQFPFGSPLKKVQQQDQSPKKVFVLGVYASAVHAKWLDSAGTTKINALAVSSEPYIFWRGDGAKVVIDKINIPAEVGTLRPADERFNGPSGKVLDDLFLTPLGYERDDAWLSDLIPYTRINRKQRAAIETHYQPLIKKYNLPECTIPNFTESELGRQKGRHKEIMDEIRLSKCKTIILLGNSPIKYWLSYYSNYKKLSDFGDDPKTYGQFHDIEIEGIHYDIIPLAHPRQAGNLGEATKKWNVLHRGWINRES